VCLALGALLAACSPSAAARAQPAPPTVILISLDGVRHDQPDRGPLPAFERMAGRGGRAERLVSVLPSSTCPAHVSMATGTHPDRHGIVANRFHDAAGEPFSRRDTARWIEAEPLWIAVERQGVRAATFFWVGSETDWRGRRATERRAPFDDGIDEDAKVAQILAWLDTPPPARPGLIMSWWHGTDAVGHRKGPDHPDVFAQLADQDRALGRLLDGIDARGLWDATTLLVVSDHGMTVISREVPVAERLEALGIDADLDLGAGQAFVRLRDPESDFDRALGVLRALDGVEAHPADRLPADWRLGYPGRVGDIVLVATPPCTFERLGMAAALAYRVLGAFGWTRGGHGHDPRHPDMAGIFFALGRGVAPGARWGAVRSIDIAATVARLLGVAPPAQSEGEPIAGIAPPAP
jgi:arylsulfatase A-like enzyme